MICQYWRCAALICIKINSTNQQILVMGLLLIDELKLIGRFEAKKSHLPHIPQVLLIHGSAQARSVIHCTFIIALDLVMMDRFVNRDASVSIGQR